MRCFADSAVDADVSPLLREHLVHGVTTNPELLLSAGVARSQLPGLVRRWIDLGAREVFLQTWGEDRATMLANAAALRSIAPQVGVKVPATETGFGVAATLADDGASVLVTAVYSAPQAVLAASIGARYIAPYLGRLDDEGRDGAAEIAVMANLVRGTGTEVLAASIRSPERLVDLALLGVTSCTARPHVLRAAMTSASSEASAAAFEHAMQQLAH